jgi:hypothetical protein
MTLGTMVKHTVKTDAYMMAHGSKPAGFGVWDFQLVKSNGESVVASFGGTWSDVAASATMAAVESGAMQAILMA